MPSTLSGQQSLDSSLHRSALNISVGDTKSIVFALQALQSKIRQLEKDRDYHHDQYEKAINSHESFKAIMEAKMEEERSAHRKRESELCELLRQTVEEKSRISGPSVGTTDAIAQLREELEVMLSTEKKKAEERERKLLAEIQHLHQTIKREQLEHAALLMKFNNFQLDQQNSQTDCLGREAKEVPSGREGTSFDNNQGSYQHRRAGTSHERTEKQYNTGYSSMPGRSLCQCSCPCHGEEQGCQKEGNQMAGDPEAFCYTNTYRDPTCNSMLRDVRNVLGVAPCVHPASYNETVSLDHNASGLQREEVSHLAPAALATAKPVNLSTSSIIRPRKGPDAAVTNRIRKRASSMIRKPRNHSGPHARLGTSDRTKENLTRELRILKHQLHEFLSSPSLSQMSVEEMRSYFQRLKGQIDRKEEQLSLLQWRKDNPHEVARVGNPSRIALMNEMRAIASNALDQQ